MASATYAALALRSHLRGPAPLPKAEYVAAHTAAIARTVRRVPEVMIKMLNEGGRDAGSVARHLRYIDRGGELEIETDDVEALKGKGVADALIEDWGLDLDEKRRTADLKPRATSEQPKLVHKMIFSMPAGTPPEKVLAAVKDFAREEFGAKHRYAMVLHTDEPHPHVHMVVRAMGYDGQRLRIRKATLQLGVRNSPGTSSGTRGGGECNRSSGPGSGGAS